MSQTNEKAYTEILEIIKYLPNEEYDKIPKEKLEFYKTHQDSLYHFEYDPTKSLNEQNVLRETKVLIVNLFRDVVATAEQIEKLNIILSQNEQEYQEKLREEYSYDKLFSKEEVKDKKAETIQSENLSDSTQMIVYKENIFSKIYNFFKRIFDK